MQPKGHAAGLVQAIAQDDALQAQKVAWKARWRAARPGASALAADQAWRLEWRRRLVDHAARQGIVLPPNWRAPNDVGYSFRAIMTQANVMNLHQPAGAA